VSGGAGESQRNRVPVGVTIFLRTSYRAQKSARGWRTPRRPRESMATEFSVSFWGAPALWRFPEASFLRDVQARAQHVHQSLHGELDEEKWFRDKVISAAHARVGAAFEII